VHHAARRREVPASGPRHHDHRRHLIAPSARRGSLLPVSHHCRPGACKRRSRAAEHAKIGARTAAAAKIHRGSSICRRLRRPALPAPRSLPHQIPIDGKPSAEPPRVPSLKAFGHRPSAPDDRSSNGPVSETLHKTGPHWCPAGPAALDPKPRFTTSPADDRGICDRRRRQRCVLTLQSDKLRPCEAERVAIFGCRRAGRHRISLRRHPQGRRIRSNGPEIRRMSVIRKKYKWPTNP